MGIKFLGTKVAGREPTITQLGLRELAINLTDKTIFTSDGLKIIELGSSTGSIGFTPNTRMTTGALVVNSAGDALYISPNTYTTGASIAADVAAGSLIPVSKATKTLAWTSGTAYTSGQMVYGQNGEGLFVVPVSYTSGVDIQTDVANNNLVSAVTIPSEVGGIAFNPTQSYKVGDIITYNGVVYTFNTAHLAGAWIGPDATPVGIDTWIGLSDTPATYIANGAVPGNIVVQNASANGVTFTDTVDGGTF